jgi:RNA polymerase subunit RPABC4/transcription elongation factor Spt4
VASDFLLCPACGTSIVSSCHACRKVLSPDWQFCPYCRTPKAPPNGEIRIPV